MKDEINKLWSIKELADDIGTNKTKIFRIIKNLKIETQQNRNKILLSDANVNTIKRAISKEKRNSISKQNQNSETIFVLKKELSIAHKQNEKLQKLLDQQQQLQLKTQQMLEEKTLLLDSAQKRKWWKFFKK